MTDDHRVAVLIFRQQKDLVCSLAQVERRGDAGVNALLLSAGVVQARLRGAKDSPGLLVGPCHPGLLLAAKIRLNPRLAIRSFSSSRFQKFSRDTRRNVREMEFRLIPGAGKLPKVAEHPLGRLG